MTKVKQEKYGIRDLTYSAWHRTLSAKCYGMDLDFLEFRNGKIKAVFELKHWRNSEMSDFEKKIIMQVATALKVPAILVKYNFDIEPYQFKLTHLQSGKTKTMSEFEYREWLENL